MISKLLILLFAATFVRAEIKNRAVSPTPEYFLQVTKNATLDCTSLSNCVQFEVNGEKLESGSNIKIQNNTIFLYDIDIEMILKNYTCYNDTNIIIFDKHPIFNYESTKKFNKFESENAVLSLEIKNQDLNCSWILDVNESVQSLNQTLNIKLHTKNLTFSGLLKNNSGKYGCVLENNYGSLVAYFVLSVHKNYASLAIFPFLGVCIECAVACFLVFFFEKKNEDKQSHNQYEIDQQTFMTQSRITKI